MRAGRAAAALALLLAAAPAAWGEADPPGEARISGIRAGVWLIEPEIEAGVRFDDNIFREETGGAGSLILRTAPSAALSSDWRRHSVSLKAGAEAGVYTSSSADDYLDGRLRFEGVLDASRAARLRLRAGAAREHEPRGDDDADFGLAEPIGFARFDADLTGQYAPGRLRIQPLIGIERLDFGDAPLLGGGISDQDDRDRTILRASLLAGWRWSPKTEFFAEGRFARIDFDDPLDRGGFGRDGEALAALLGARFEVTRLVEGSVAAGLAHRAYDDPALRGFTAPTAEAAVIWAPTRLLTIDASLSRRLEETTVAPASGSDVITVGLSGRWAIRRFLDLTAATSFERNRFRGAARTDETLRVGLGAAWKVRRDTELIAGYEHVRERSDAPGEDSDANLLSLTARHRF